jgi:ribonuclease J
MANSEHRQMEIVKGDLVILSSSPIPGNEKSVYKVINQLIKKGAKVIYESLADVHVSGHAKQEELKLIHTLVRPKYFMPVHGEYVHLDRHRQLALDLGMHEKNIFIMSNGSSLEFGNEGAKFGKSVPAGRVFIDGLGVGDVGNIVLRDRKHLSEDGLIIVVVAISSTTGEVVNGPDLISRGFVYVRESEALMDGARHVIDEELKKCFEKNIKDWASLKSSVKDTLSQYIYQSTKRSPMILPVFMEV